MANLTNIAVISVQTNVEEETRKQAEFRSYKCKDTCRGRSSRPHPTTWLGADWTRHHYRYVLGTAAISHKNLRSEGTSSNPTWPSLGPKALHLNFCIQLPNIWTLFISGWRREQTGNSSIIRASCPFFHSEYVCTPKDTTKRVKRPAKTMQTLYKTTCLPLDEHRFTKTSNKTGQEEFPRGDHSLPRLCCSPALGQRQKHTALLSQFSRARSHQELPLTLKDSTTPRISQVWLRLLKDI